MLNPKERKGLLRLMLKWPEMRSRLADLAQSDTDFAALCEAYEDACAALEIWRRSPAALASVRILEYQQLISELESDIVLALEASG